MSVRWSYCNDIGVIILKCEFSHMSKTNKGLISANVIRTAPDDYVVITVQMTHFTAS